MAAKCVHHKEHRARDMVDNTLKLGHSIISTVRGAMLANPDSTISMLTTKQAQLDKAMLDTMKRILQIGSRGVSHWGSFSVLFLAFETFWVYRAP